MQKQKKRFLCISSVLLCLMMLFVILPTTAFADPTLGSGGCTYTISGSNMVITGSGTLDNPSTVIKNNNVLSFSIQSGVSVVAPASMSKFFDNCMKLKSVDLTGLDTSNVTDMSSMFFGCQELTTVELSTLNTSNVTNMQGMFSNCWKLTSLDLSSFDTSNVTTMSNMFTSCNRIETLNLSSFDTAKVEAMGGMFTSCYKLASVDLSSFDTSQVVDFSHMFYQCSKLTSLDLSSFDTSNALDMSRMFYQCYELASIYAGDNWTTAALVLSNNKMFDTCPLLEGGQGTSYAANQTNGVANYKNEVFAKIDGGTANPGYLTKGPAPSATVAVTTTSATSNYIRCDVTFDVQGHGTAPDMQREKSGHTITEPVEPTASGYTFAGWYKEPECENIWHFDTQTIHSDITLYAKWVSADYEEGNPKTGELSDEFIRIMAASIILLTLFTVSFAAVYGKKRSH